jgi:hypothetical protein
VEVFTFVSHVSAHATKLRQGGAREIWSASQLLPVPVWADDGDCVIAML